MRCITSYHITSCRLKRHGHRIYSILYAHLAGAQLMNAKLHTARVMYLAIAKQRELLFNQNVIQDDS